MLYQSTRDKIDTFTAHRVLRENCPKDGGCFLPFRIPMLEKEEYKKLSGSGFLDNLATLLNRFFNTTISAWDLECVLGKTPAVFMPVSQKVTFVQLWNNPKKNFRYLLRSTYRTLVGNESGKEAPTLWARLAIRISFVCAAVIELGKQGIQQADFAVNAGDFEQAFAVYYSKQMGLPIRKIIIGCNDNSNLWDFVNRGVFHCDASVHKTDLPDLDVAIPVCFEAFLFTAFGHQNTCKYLQCMAESADYQLEEEQLTEMGGELFASVIGSERVALVRNSMKRTDNCDLDPYTAVSVAALQDYRAKTGESRSTIIFAEYSPKG